MDFMSSARKVVEAAVLCLREFAPYLTESDRKVVEELIEQEKGIFKGF
jgi:hypothetical protein